MADEVLLQDLYDHLNREIEFHRRHIRILQRERDALCRSDLESLQECIQEKETHLTEKKVLEESRKLLLGKMTRLWGTPSEGPNLRYFLDKMEEPWRSRIEERREELVACVAESQYLLECNQKLVKSALSHINGSIGFITGLLSKGFSYSPKGNLVTMDTPSLAVDDRA